MQILRILAILTPKGRRLSPAVRLHDCSTQLGCVLCDGGNSAWPAEPQKPRPVLSEERLARLLTTPAAQRGETVERIARMLARSRTPERGINCSEIAGFLLHPNDPRLLQKIARDYYAKLDYADRNSTKEGTAE
jgi:CRISPR system Cascade subunit CasB